MSKIITLLLGYIACTRTECLEPLGLVTNTCLLVRYLGQTCDIVSYPCKERFEGLLGLSSEMTWAEVPLKISEFLSKRERYMD